MQPDSVPARRRRLDEIAEGLPQRASALTRLFLARTDLPLSRTETAVLRAVSTHPQRVTALAAGEGLTQPAITRVVNRLADSGWVAKETHPADGRVVMVTITPLGRDLFETVRAEYAALVHEEMAALADEDVETLARAIDVLDELIARLQQREG
jgi:DNA-binding MarR family transcriptional regulator